MVPYSRDDKVGHIQNSSDQNKVVTGACVLRSSLKLVKNVGKQMSTFPNA